MSESPMPPDPSVRLDSPVFADAPTLPDPPPDLPLEPIDPPPPPPIIQAQAQISDGLVVAIGYFPAGSSSETVAIVDIYDEAEAAKLSEPGTKHIDLDTGVITVTPPPPPPIRYSSTLGVEAYETTTDDVAREVYRVTLEPKHLYRAELRVRGSDRVSGVSRDMVGIFSWRRWAGGALAVGVTIVSNLGEAASASWAPNALPSGNDIVFTVKGAAGRTVDWELIGTIGVYAPEGL